MWLKGVAGVLFGIICVVQQACSESKVIHRKAVPVESPVESPGLDEDIQSMIQQIYSLSDPKGKSHNRGYVPLPIDGVDLNAYYSVLNNLYVLLQPLLREGLLEDLPKILVCVLSGKEDCGLEAELIRALSLEMGPMILAGLSTLTTPTCPLLYPEEESHSFFRTYLRMGDSAMLALAGVQDMLVNVLTHFPVSGNLVKAVSGLLDTIIKYALEILFRVLEVPVEYIKIVLQFGIRVPSLDEQGKCEHGDLKQLIMWGVRQNVSWSFGAALVDILLDIFFTPEQSICTYPGSNCPGPSDPFQRTSQDSSDNGDIYHNILLKCDHKDLAEWNDTVCTEILATFRKPSSASVVMFCQALSLLDSNQIKYVWRNACSVLQAVMSPLTARLSEDCPSVGPFPSPDIYLPGVTPSHQDVPVRVGREASNLNELICNYNSWMGMATVDPALLSLCADNQRGEFVRNVCNTKLLKKLVADPIHLWLFGYCLSSSADRDSMVREVCVYEQWMLKNVLIDPQLLKFCLVLDRNRLSLLVCENVNFLMLLFSNEENIHLMPNCSQVQPLPIPPEPIDPCQYSLWHEPSQIHTSILSQCVMFDKEDFNRDVCANQTFLKRILINKQNDWLQQHCEKVVSEMASSLKEKLNTTLWCDYGMWASRYVDDSVVGWCWQHDQLAFQKNVCCNEVVFERLLQDPRNVWLRSICNETEGIDKDQIKKQVCVYELWFTPIIVDMTDLATCAWADPDNFVAKVCLNDTVFKNLMANQDNTWLKQHCHNSTSKGGGPDEGQGQGVVDFKPGEQCLYSSWRVSPPPPALVTLCSEQDQANFMSTICSNPSLFIALSQQPSNKWLGGLCAAFVNYTSGGTGEQLTCTVKELVKKFNWTCSHDLALACRPGAGQNVVMQTVVRCWLESMRTRMEGLLTPEVTVMLDQAVSLVVVSLLALEEIQNTTYHVTENIRHNIMAFVDRFFKTEANIAKKRVILQCFGRVLTSLMQTTRDLTQDEFVFIQEYFKIPVNSLRGVFSQSHITTIRMILLHYSRNKNSLQLPQNFLSMLTSVLFQTHLATDWSLFPELASLLALASPLDILHLPLLQNNVNVREIINQNLPLMSLEQRLAFGAWFGITMDPINIIRGQQSLIRDTGNLIAYLPFNNFQHLSAAQLLDGLDLLQRNTLSHIKQEFIAQRIIGTYKNLTRQDFIRLGSITCLAEPDDLLVYKSSESFPVIQDIIRQCTRDGLRLPSNLFSSLLLNSTQTKEPSLLTVEQIKETAHLLPMLGVTFIQRFTPSQLLSVLPVIKSVTFSPAQASVIVEKLSSVYELNYVGRLQELGSLVVGVKSELLSSMTSEKLLSSLPSMAQQMASLSPTQANAIVTKLWGYSDVFDWLDYIEPLLYCTPLASVLPRTQQLVINSSTTTTMPWNTQQAQAIFKTMLELKPDLVKEDFESLGTLGQGVTCKVILSQLRASQSPSSVRQVLLFLQQQPAPLHTSLKKCVVDEVHQYKFFPEVLTDFGAELVLSIPLSDVKIFPADVIDSLRALVVDQPQYFLLMSRRKRELLVHKIAQKMNMYKDVYTAEEFRSLGIMATFVTDEMFDHLDRSFFKENIDFLQTLCYSTTKMDIVARILQEPAAFGPVKTWTKATLSQVSRFLFFLPRDRLEEIPLELMTLARIERLFISQRQWDSGMVGSHCLDANEKRSNFEKQQFVLQFFLGFLKSNNQKSPIPTCELLHSTTASVWTINSLVNMSTSAFVNCLELMGQDPFLSPNHRRQLLKKVQKIFGPVSGFSPRLISQLGRIAVEMTNEELSTLQLSEWNTIAALGAVDIWTSEQQEILFAAVLNSTNQRVSQLESGILVAMGHIVCGTKEIGKFNSVELSKAVHNLGLLRLKCTQDQLKAMIMLLNNNLAFGLTPFWGTDVFIEIGVIAAGLPDDSMSSLVRSQIEGLTTLAISVIPPKKFQVVFSPLKIRMFSYEQAEAVSSEVIDELSDLQKKALAMVLMPYEGRLVDFRGRSLGRTLSHCPVSLLLGLLVLHVIPS